MKTFLVLLAGALLVPAPARAQSVAGEWDAAMNTPGGVRNFKLVFSVTGDSLRGTVKRAAGDVTLVGVVKGDSLSFSYLISYEGNPLLMSIKAAVVGDSLKGFVDFGGMLQDSFWAKRVAPAPPPAAGFLQSPAAGLLPLRRIRGRFA